MVMTASAPAEVITAAPPGRVAGKSRDLQNVQDLQRVAAKVRPPSLAGGRLLPVVPGLREILPAGGLQRGATVVIDAVRAAGATTLALELLAGPSVGGYWCAVAGGVELGLVAAAERGIDLARLLLVPSLGPPDRWMQVVAALFDSVDVVLFVPQVTVRQSDARRLVARSRERESVFLVLDHRGHWQGPSDLRCTVTRSEWSGLSRGHGLLTARRYDLEVSGRGAAARPRRAPLQLPA